METYDTPFNGFSLQKRKNKTAGVLYLPLINGITFIGLPLFVWKYGVHWSEIALFVFFFAATSMAITMGYHRLFAHATFKTGKLMEFLMLFFGAATYEGSALKWASMHRRHHQFTDTERDPYNIKQGFFYAHMGWFIFWKQSVEYNNVGDLQKSRLLMHQHSHYQLWAFTAGVVFPLLMGALTGHLAGAAMWSVVARMTLVYHSAFFINSFAHYFGSQPYDKTVSARDNWVGAILTNGEGYHNFHHTFPRDYRNGIRWYHWDPTKWAIWTLAKFGGAKELRRTPDELVRNKRLATAAQAAEPAPVLSAS